MWLGALLLFLGVAFGLAWPLAARLAGAPAERVVTTVAFSLLGAFLFSWVVYIFALPQVIFWALPALAAAGLLSSRQTLRETLQNPDARALIFSQLLVTAWCVAWLGFITSYSGGGWTGDWLEHRERALFFLERWPRDYRFLGIYPLTARPPLVNVLTATFLSLNQPSYVCYQMIVAAFSSLVFLPAALIARRFAKGPHAILLLAVLFMLNPLFVQNATFPWTKLPAAFFVLTALYFLLRSQDSDAPHGAAWRFSVGLAGGMLAHYSAGPYLVLFSVAWLLLGWRQRFDAAWYRQTALAAVAGIALLATWFGWSFAVYGIQGTLATNTTVVDQATTVREQLVKIALNLYDTLVPFFLRPLDTSLIQQRSPWGAWRDQFFQLYQLNLFFALGSVAWLAIARLLLQRLRQSSVRERQGWVLLIAGTVVLGVAAHGGRDHWGLTHICLQPLVLFALAFLAAHWRTLGPGWRRALVAGATVDFILGIALHFAVQHYSFDRWVAPDRPLFSWSGSYTLYSQMNLNAKTQLELVFFADYITAASAVLLALLASILALAMWRAHLVQEEATPLSPRL